MPARRLVAVGVADPWDGQGNMFIVIRIGTYPYARSDEGETNVQCRGRGGRKEGKTDR